MTDHRGTDPGPLWVGQREPLSVSGVTQIVLAVGAAQIPALLGHANLETDGRYFGPVIAAQADAIHRIFDT